MKPPNNNGRVVPFRTAYDRHMDELAGRIGEVLDGERLEDCVSACACVIGLSLAELPPRHRAKVRATLLKFIDQLTETHDAARRPD